MYNHNHIHDSIMIHQEVYHDDHIIMSKVSILLILN